MLYAGLKLYRVVFKISSTNQYSNIVRYIIKTLNVWLYINHINPKWYYFLQGMQTTFD